jgi:hypothetical protein
MVGSCSGRVLLKLYRRTVACGRLRSCGCLPSCVGPVTAVGCLRTSCGWQWFGACGRFWSFVGCLRTSCGWFWFWSCSGRSCTGWLAAAPDGFGPAVGPAPAVGFGPLSVLLLRLVLVLCRLPADGWLCSCGRSCSGWLAAAPDGVIEAVPSDGCLRMVLVLRSVACGCLPSCVGPVTADGPAPADGWQLLRSGVIEAVPSDGCLRMVLVLRSVLYRSGVIEAAPDGCVPAPDGWQLLRSGVFLCRSCSGWLPADVCRLVSVLLLRTVLLLRLVGSCSGWCY